MSPGFISSILVSPFSVLTNVSPVKHWQVKVKSETDNRNDSTIIFSGSPLFKYTIIVGENLSEKKSENAE